jgi:protein-tyrosine phosphatase
VEVLARGLVVLFPEPINQKAEAILISNGIHMEGFTSVQLTEEDLEGDTLTLTMERTQRERLLEMYGEDKAEDIQVLTDLVGDELEILDPYGGALPSYGLCYETLRKSIKKLVKLLNDNERTVTNEGE